jgi:hypothetical protein
MLFASLSALQQPCGFRFWCLACSDTDGARRRYARPGIVLGSHCFQYCFGLPDRYAEILEGGLKLVGAHLFTFRAFYL